jgi:hypothetical protein
MRRHLLLVALLLAPPLAVLVPALVVYSYIAYDLPPRLGEEARAAAMAPLRAVVDGGKPERPSHPELQRALPAQGTVIVSLWSGGRRVVRVQGHGATTADAILDGAAQLGADPGLAALAPAQRAEARLQVDVVSAKAPLVTRWKATRSLGVVAGLDGIGVRVSGREIHHGADELAEQRLLDASTPIPMVQEFKVGLEFDHADAELAKRAALSPGAYGVSTREYYRFRADSFVEAPTADRQKRRAPVPLFRGLPPGPPLSAEALRSAAVRGSRYLMKHLHENGRYVYQVDLVAGTATDPNNLRGDYSLPRHAGTTYFLGEVYAETRDPELRAHIERALDHMVFLIEQGGCKGQTPEGKPFMCVVDKGQRRTNLGSTALAVVAIAEYRLATNDPRYDAVQLALVEWMLSLQKPSGRFAHLYEVPTHTPDWKTELLYFDGEAALALVRSYKVFKDERMIRAAERALDALTGWYDFFAGQFFFGEEHWTCIAAEAAWPELKHDRYREFCSDYAAFLRTQQFVGGETPTQEDLAGAYSVTPFFVPHNTPVGSRSEAMISSYLLTKYHGKPDARIRRQVLAAVTYLLRQQIGPDSDFFTPTPFADGAMPSSPIDRTVRIDYVQHACSAMLRAIELLADEGAPAAAKK